MLGEHEARRESPKVAPISASYFFLFFGFFFYFFFFGPSGQLIDINVTSAFARFITWSMCISTLITIFTRLYLWLCLLSAVVVLVVLGEGWAQLLVSF